MVLLVVEISISIFCANIQKIFVLGSFWTEFHAKVPALLFKRSLGDHVMGSW